MFKKAPLTAIFLFAFIFSNPPAIKAQSGNSRYKSADDSLLISNQHKRLWHPYAGLHLSSDAEMYYLGPSFEVGSDVTLTKHLALGTYFHYFYVGVNNRTDGLIEKGRLRTFTWALLLQLNAGAGWYKGFFIGFGLALQRYADRFQGPFGSWNDKRSTATLAIRTGYTFAAGFHAIAIEFNGIGPYTYSDGYGTITEIFTQVSFGGRFIF